MTDELLEIIEINTADSCDHAVIWLHGLGASGHDFEPIVPELRLPSTRGVRFVFPHAPIRPITINGGASMRGWYDINSLDFDQREQDSTGIQDSATRVNALIEAEITNGIAPENIILAGFSQGGAIALYNALTGPFQLGGILALSTYLPIHEQAIAGQTRHATEQPVFMAHGQFDDVINIRFAEQSRQLLEQNGFKIDWKVYPMAHNVSAEQIKDISRWMIEQFDL